jgi:hypothetical protein
MAACTFLTQHRNRAGDHAGEPQQDMNSHNRQEHWIGGGDLDPRDIRDSIGHMIFPVGQVRSRYGLRPR